METGTVAAGSGSGRESHGRRRRQLAKGGRDVGPGREPGHDPLHVRPSLPASGVEHLPVVRFGQVRREQPHGREVDRALREPLEDRGESPGGPGGLDVVVGLVLGECQRDPAVGEEEP